MYRKTGTALFLLARQSSKMQSTHRNGAHRLKACELVVFAITGHSALGALEHTQQRLPQVLKPQTEYATFAYVEGGERPPNFLIQEGPLSSWSYRKHRIHDHQMGKARWGVRSQQRSSPSGRNSCIS